MRPRVFINGRSLTRDQPTGVDQLPTIVATLAPSETTSVLVPGRPGRLRTNVWEQTALAWRARHGVLLSLANSGPLVARRHVTMIHDLSPWDHPEWFDRAYRTKSRVMGWAWAHQSAAVLTPSHFSANRAAEILGIADDRLRVVGNAHRWGSDIPARSIGGAPYVLTVSTLSTRKHLVALLDAWPAVRARHPDARLKIVGADGLPMLAGETSVRNVDGVDYLGYVDDPTLDSLLLGARVVASASVYEGFNIPLLDALCVGVPIAASDIPVHRELYGEVARLFDPHDADAAAEALCTALADGDVDPRTCADFGERFGAAAVVGRVLAAAHGDAVDPTRGAPVTTPDRSE